MQLFVRVQRRVTVCDDDTGDYRAASADTLYWQEAGCALQRIADVSA